MTHIPGEEDRQVWQDYREWAPWPTATNDDDGGGGGGGGGGAHHRIPIAEAQSRHKLTEIGTRVASDYDTIMVT